MGSEKTEFEKCVVWDTAGQEKFADGRLSYYEGSTHAIIMYDDRKVTENHVIQYLQDIRRICGDIPVLCLQNKNDITKDIRQYAISTRDMRREELVSLVNSNFGITLLN
jgi:Ras-related protein Rab-1A